MAGPRIACSFLIFNLILLFFAVTDGSYSCGGTLTAMTGEISSPLYPGDYPTNITCVWEIEGGHSHINLTWLEFQLEHSPVCKDFDFLEVGYDSNRMTRLCGYRAPAVWSMQVKGSKLTIKFVSDNSITGKGFKLTYAKYDIDGCLTDNGGCNHFCQAKGGDVVCSCKEGYRNYWVKGPCYDIDECRYWEPKHNCSAANKEVCKNIPGSFTCVCGSGFRRNEQTQRCEDIDECRQSPPRHNCNKFGEYCVNTGGHFQCVCKDDFTKSRDSRRCEDLYCPKGWVQADTSCYVAPPGAASWARARQRCLALGADLVSINSARENKAVASLTTNLRRRDVWIGLFPDPGDKKRWLWSDGSRPGFTGWRRWDAMRFMTARRCIRHTPNGLWWYSACEHEKYFVCEKEVTEPPTTPPTGNLWDY